jgi:hypothetical protein
MNLHTAFEDHEAGSIFEARKKRKRKGRNASVTYDIPILESDNERNTSPFSSTSNVTNVISQGVSVEGRQS